MRFKSVLLIIPEILGYFGFPNEPHPGAGYLLAALQSRGVEATGIDMHLSSWRLLSQRIKRDKPECIGVTIYTYRHKAVYELIRRIKRHFDIPIVIGGPHVSLYKDQSFQNGLIDYAVKHEGEKAFGDLCAGVVLNEIGNLLFMRNGAVIENAALPFNTRLDDLAMPVYPGLDLTKYRTIGIISSRGCPNQCIYCPVLTTMGRNFRARSPENLAGEIKYWYQKGFRRFNFVDDVFLEIPQRIFMLCELIEKEGFKDLHLACHQGIRADKVTREILTRMKQVGFRSIGIGVESFNDTILRRIKKNLTVKQIEEAVKIACELKYDVGLFFMLGFEGESPEDVERSFEFAGKYPVEYANFYNIVPYPGTELFEEIRHNNGFLVKPEAYLNCVNTRIRKPVFAIRSMTVAERVRLLNKGFNISRSLARKSARRHYAHIGIWGVFLARVLTARFTFYKVNRVRSFLQKLFLTFGKKFPEVRQD